MRSDFSAIHGYRNPMEELSAATYFELAERLAAYPGMMRVHAEAEAERRVGLERKLDELGGNIDRLKAGGTVGSASRQAAAPSDSALSRGVMAADARLREVIDFD